MHSMEPSFQGTKQGTEGTQEATKNHQYTESSETEEMNKVRCLSVTWGC